MKIAKNYADKAIDLAILLFFLFFSLTIIMPFWTMLVDSFSTEAFFLKKGIKLWPMEATLEPYRQVFANEIIGTAYFNTLFRTVVGASCTVAVCFAAAYAISRQGLPLKRTITALIVFTMFFGGGLIPTYLWYKQLGLINNRLALILPHLAVPYYILIMRNFLQVLPAELEESALMDGASPYRIFLSIIIPVSTPVLATVCLWSAVFHWNEWFGAMIYTPKRSLMVLQLMLRRILLENQASAMLDMPDSFNKLPEETVKAATMFITIGPIILVYPFVQKYFVKGIMTGSVKG